MNIIELAKFKKMFGGSGGGPTKPEETAEVYSLTSDGSIQTLAQVFWLLSEMMDGDISNGNGKSPTIHYKLVESLPALSDLSIKDDFLNGLLEIEMSGGEGDWELPCFVLKSTGEPYVSVVNEELANEMGLGVGVVSVSTVLPLLGFEAAPYNGTVNTPDEVAQQTETGMYTYLQVAENGGGGDNTVIDVDALPTENVEQDKIYRVASGEKDAYDIWLTIHPDELYNYPGLTNPVNIIDLYKMSSYGECVTNIHVVDSLPEVGEPDYNYVSVTNTTYNNVYLIPGDNTYEVYYYCDYGDGDCEWLKFGDGNSWLYGPYLGTITDPSQIDTASENYGFYIMNRKVSTPTVYGIPDEGDNKTVFEYKSEGGWKDACGLKDVTELPTENIEQDKVYRVTKETSKEVTEIWIVMNEPRYWTTTNPINLHYIDCCNGQSPLTKTNIHVVDSLPEVGEENHQWDDVSGTNVFNYYVIAGDPTSPAYFYNGRWFSLSEYDVCGQYRGTVTDLAQIDISEEGYYIVKRQVSEVTTVYGIPDEYNNKSTFEYMPECGWLELGNLEAFVDVDAKEVEINLPNTVELRNYAFYMMYQKAFTAINAPKLRIIGANAFNYCAGATFTSLPDTVTTINDDSFGYCEGLKTLSLPKSLRHVGPRAFGGCSGLTEVTFNSYVDEMYRNAFNACNNIRVINVPWSEGYIANAPWGATNATINYNYTGE